MEVDGVINKKQQLFHQSSLSVAGGNVPVKETQLPSCTTTEILWRR